VLDQNLDHEWLDFEGHPEEWQELQNFMSEVSLDRDIQYLKKEARKVILCSNHDVEHAFKRDLIISTTDNNKPLSGGEWKVLFVAKTSVKKETSTYDKKFDEVGVDEEW